MTANALQQKRRTPLGDAFRQLLKNQLAVIGGVFIILLLLLAIFANQIAPHPFDGANYDLVYEPPMTRADDGRLFIFGTDYLGRDNLSRTIFGTRISLTVALVASLVSLIVGLVYGLISGYSSAVVDNLMMRVVDFIWGLPGIIFIILIQVLVKAYSARAAAQGVEGFAGRLVALDQAMGGILFVFVAIGLFNWISMARIARGQTLAIRNKEFVEAARATGTSDRRIIFRHILPNILGPCLIFESLAIPGYILLEAFLSFIGLGANPPTPSWGIMISETRDALRTYPYALFVPSIALTLTVLAFNFLGDGLRDAFDPRQRE